MNNTRNQTLIIAFGKHIRFLRKEKKLTMEKLAELANVEYTQIANIERGKTNTTISTAYALAKALSVSFEKLFTFEI